MLAISDLLLMRWLQCKEPPHDVTGRDLPPLLMRAQLMRGIVRTVRVMGRVQIFSFLHCAHGEVGDLGGARQVEQEYDGSGDVIRLDQPLARVDVSLQPEDVLLPCAGRATQE